jgi:hypothetical protein
MALNIVYMKKSKVHNIIAILVATAMSLTSIGFTTVVGYCSMSISSVCCCESDRTSKTAIPSKAQTLDHPNFSCYSEKIVGGSMEIHGVVAENITCKTSFALLEAITPDFQNTLTTSNPTLRLPLDFRDLASSQSDIYLQVRSFLI